MTPNESEIDALKEDLRLLNERNHELLERAITAEARGRERGLEEADGIVAEFEEIAKASAKEWRRDKPKCSDLAAKRAIAYRAVRDIIRSRLTQKEEQ